MKTLGKIMVIGSAVAMGISLVAAIASAQWLPDEVQQRERKLWERTGVAFPEGAKFYQLPKVGQRLVGIVNYSPVNRYGIFDDRWRGFDGRSENVNAQLPWVTPAGLHWTDKSGWRKASAAYFPGDIAVWVENVMVENSVRDPRGGFFKQPQPHVRWAFPDGTMFAELLIRVRGGAEQVFEIRTREKRDGKWGDGTTFRPFTDPTSLPKGTVKATYQVPPGKLADFGLDWSNLVTYTLPPGADVPERLAPSRLTVAGGDDRSLLPTDYLGNVRSCAACHDKAGKPTSYGSTTIRGSDSVLSWMPFKAQNVNTDAMPVIDERWPIRRK